jgi:DNA-binding XRE family transcriptional regulator
VTNDGGRNVPERDVRGLPDPDYLQPTGAQAAEIRRLHRSGAIERLTVAEARARRGWTQERLARLANLSIETVRAVEQGQRAYVRRSTHDKLCHALGEVGFAGLAVTPYGKPRPGGGGPGGRG